MSGTRSHAGRMQLAIIMGLIFAILGAAGLYPFAQPRITAAIASTEDGSQSRLSRAMNFTQAPEPKR